MHILIPVLPLVAQELVVSPGKIQLTITLYLFGIAGGQLLYGPVSDKSGRRSTLLATPALFVGAGAVAGWATSIATLVSVRIVQAVGGCGGLVLDRAIVRDSSASGEAASRMALLTIVQSLAPGIGPAVGGLLGAWPGRDPRPIPEQTAGDNYCDLKGGNMAIVEAEPYPFHLDPAHASLVIIDVQRDFLEPGDFGAALGNDVSLLRRTIVPTRRLLQAVRAAGLSVIHTREGHRPDLADLPPAKKARGRLVAGIGDPGPMGRILVRGEPGHDIIPELYPLPGEPVVDKPGKGAFHATDLDAMLKNRGIAQLIVSGVTTEVCVNTTVREANDRGYECIVVADCVGSYFPEFEEMGLRMIKAQGGIFGWVAPSEAVSAAPPATRS